MFISLFSLFIYSQLITFPLFLFFAFIHFHSIPYHNVIPVSLTLPIQNLTHSHRVVILSDLHLQQNQTTFHPKLIKQSIDIILQSNPELVIFLGDYIQLAHEDILLFIKSFEFIAHKFKGIGIIGNHDIKLRPPNDIIKALQSIGISILLNEEYVFDCFHFFGIDYYTNNSHLLLPQNQQIVLLSHTPSVLNDTIFSESNENNQQNIHISAIFCGHTHGGQVNIPFIGSPLLLFKAWMLRWWKIMYLRLLDLQKWKVIYGLYHLQYNKSSIPVYVTSGIGSHYGFKVNCPPEVVVVDLIP
ncbi:ser/thr protein phosphatase family protein [Entamoeba histolytica HM-1:IMSS]|uniref:Ser/thr protein phosphatase family protein n=2 Tax=Entamoeba histolytica TaxID=5759 RepID=C4M4Y8_ENTH1|nr:ser/thr protein phosphatase family protein [Entamoeba histolytica HM-1:IMSS]EAL50838.2 ser/thr protein phosphatase family protein [Entamoeba histolytica HM-1:IMSS]|eukprot:XP_656225.2 ser/thr protein phosphatase family protein [Entamoeba histolytica HM-1:IMSS]